MRADRVKPGMLVRRLDSDWMVVIGPHEAAFNGWKIPLAGGAYLPVVPGADVEAVRLTEAQVAALRLVSDGEITRRWRPEKPWQWMAGSNWQPLRAAPYDRIRDLGLIIRTGRSSINLTQTEGFDASHSGRALLDLLDKEPVR